MNKKSVLLFIILILIFCTSCTNKAVIEENNINSKKIKELENKINNLETNIENYKISEDSLKTEMQFYKSFIEGMTSYLEEEEIIELAKSQWHYSIFVDEIPMALNGLIEISTDSFQLTVSEEQSSYSALPTKMQKKGKISGSIFSNHIKFLNTKPNETSGADGTIVSSTTYTFNNLSPDDTVDLEISAELQTRLSLETNILTIKFVQKEVDEQTEDNTNEIIDEE